MFLSCQSPECMRAAQMSAKFLDPRRGYGEHLAYTTKYFCCVEHELAIADELERQASYARLVH